MRLVSNLTTATQDLLLKTEVPLQAATVKPQVRWAQSCLPPVEVCALLFLFFQEPRTRLSLTREWMQQNLNEFEVNES